MYHDFSVTAAMNNRFTVQHRPHNKKLWSGTRLVDLFAADEGRDFLFSPPGARGIDLAPLNIQRERDHGLTDCNIARRAYGLAKERIFDRATSNLAVQADREVSSEQSTTSTCG
jgi:hypothetical protein